MRSPLFQQNFKCHIKLRKQANVVYIYLPKTSLFEEYQTTPFDFY